MWRRIERLNRQLQQEISKIVQGLKDPGLGFVTITAVRLTQDLQQAKVYYSVLGSQEDRENSRLALRRAAPYVRNGLNRLENLRRPPALQFVFDDTSERAQEVFALLNVIAEERKPHHRG
ncbi:MAG: 30S ribosome-binding factor RbfA [Elusimicrobia bacterium]|nr:30S ribosome-binding factor RbfA [Elusimicrobiota bacterium]